ncbi:efflux RND transporter periplasmic adaptor subunit [Thalassotalea sp. LPB0316]|uniref:efflux RND transporter periplasmic adaptor subunit n=1 Tax=Thalassotalea sp. LPB0316 TaxID=2769490 RepID=UPI001865E0B0|nr:efflux RND transporter periplasmic adaptor subunit [Thalassotalea sp. LPB0316]QOL24749.1 efflux RND transporter periplasmic adaptor subunit [Thalassotalea sp. LPB0316]
MKSTPRLLSAIFVAASMATLVGCSDDKQEVVREVVRPVEFFNVTSVTSQYIQNFPALVQPSEESALALRVGGELIEVNVVAGSTVQKGDVIARVDPTDYQVKVNEAQAAFDLAKKTFERQQRMLNLELTSQADYDMAAAQLALSEASLETAQNNLAYTVLKAPYQGVISKVHVENREMIPNLMAQSKPIVTIQSQNGIDISFQLPESILSRVKPGASSYKPQVTFTSSPTHKNKPYTAIFKEMDRTPDPKSRSYNVVLTMQNPKDINIVAGMTANVRIELDQVLEGLGEYVLVPVEAVFSPSDTDPANKEFAVWKVNPETMTVHRQSVTIDELTDQGVKVTSGLKEGDIIAAAGVHSLLENTKVREWTKQRGI